MRLVTILFFLLLTLLTTPNCSYSTIKKNILNNDAVLQQQEEQRRKLLEKKHNEQYQKSLGTDDSLQPKEHILKDDLICAHIESISITGCTLLNVDEYSAIFNSYINKCLTLADIKELLRELTNLYIKKGYITSRVFVPQQNMKSGELNLVVVEGKISSLKFNPPVSHGERQLKFAFPDLNGKKLNIRDIEQGLDQINKLPSNNAKVRLEPGSKVGTTEVIIDNQPSRTWRPGIGVDNSGQKITGPTQFIASIEKDNLLDINDLLSFSSNGDSEYIFSHKPLRSINAQSFYTMGYGYWSLTGNLGVFKYNTRIGDKNMRLRNKGQTLTGGLSLERVCLRSANTKLSIGTSFLSRCVRTYLDDTKLLASSYQLSTASIYGTGVARLFNTAFSIRGEYTKGLPILGVHPTSSKKSLSAPQATFEKGTLNLTIMRPFQLYSQRFLFSSQITAQWSPDTLYSAEQLSIGSRYTVRGFHEDSIYGSSGGYTRNDMALIIPAPLLTPFSSSVELFSGYDFGIVLEDQHEAYRGGTLQGAVLGMRTRGENLVAEITLAKPLDAPGYLNKNDFEIYTFMKFTF